MRHAGRPTGRHVPRSPRVLPHANQHEAVQTTQTHGNGQVERATTQRWGDKRFRDSLKETTMTTTHQPQPSSIHAHRLAGLVPAVLATLRTPATTVGFGAAAGYMRVCQCGYATRDPNRFAHHLEHKIGETIMNNPLALLDDPAPTIRHRLVDTARNGRIFVLLVRPRLPVAHRHAGTHPLHERKTRRWQPRVNRIWWSPNTTGTHCAGGARVGTTLTACRQSNNTGQEGRR